MKREGLQAVGQRQEEREKLSCPWALSAKPPSQKGAAGKRIF